MPSAKPEIKLRCSDEQKQRWSALAQVDGLSLSAWLAARADDAAGDDSRRPAEPGTEQEPLAAAPVASRSPTTSETEAEVEQAVAVGAAHDQKEQPEAPARVRRTVDPETLSDEEYLAWLDEYPSRAMAPGYTIKEWRALTPMARAAAAIRGGPLSAA